MKSTSSYRRKQLRGLDTLVIGARPDKLAQHRDTPAVAVLPRLTDEERVRLSELTQLRMFVGPLPHDQAHEREQLRRRLVAHGEQL